MPSSPSPNGLAQAFVIGEEFIAGEPGDAGARRQHLLRRGLERSAAARGGARARARRCSPIMCPIPSAMAWSSSMPPAGRSRSRRSPRAPKSNWAVTGLYFYDSKVVEIAKSAEAVGARRIRDHRRQPRLSRGRRAQRRAHGARLRLARHRHARFARRRREFVRTIEQRQGVKIGCPEEIAFDLGLIDVAQFKRIIDRFGKSAYGQYLAVGARRAQPGPGAGADRPGTRRRRRPH